MDIPLFISLLISYITVSFSVIKLMPTQSQYQTPHNSKAFTPNCEDLEGYSASKIGITSRDLVTHLWKYSGQESTGF
jgi:hypothetical protein